MKNINDIRAAMRPVAKRVALSVARAVLRLVNDGPPIQTAQIDLLAGETRNRVERVQEYGFTSVPLPGCKGVAVFVGGDRSHGIIVGTDDPRYRLRSLAAGEVAVYTDEGDCVVLRRGRLIQMFTNTLEVHAAAKVRFVTPLVETTGDLIDQTSGGNGNTVQQMRAIYNGHVHPENDSGGPTDAPIQGM